MKPQDLAHMNDEKVCVWSQVDCDCGTYETACGRCFDLNEGTPFENHMNFCQFCGCVLVECLADE